MKQTAVEWYKKQVVELAVLMQHQKIDLYEFLIRLRDLETPAKEMEKQQIISTYRDGRSDQQSKEGRFYNRNAEYYYNQNFNIGEK